MRIGVSTKNFEELKNWVLRVKSWRVTQLLTLHFSLLTLLWRFIA